MTKQLPEEISPSSLSPVPRRVTSASLAELLDLSPDALVIIDQTGTILQANEQAVTLFGYHHKELAGQSIEMLLPDRLQILHTTHRQHYFAAPHTRSMGLGLDLFGKRKDGREFPIDVSLRPIQLGEELLVIGALRDVSEQWRAQREQVQLAERIRLQGELLNLAHDAILMRDPLNRVIFWNTGAEALYGWTSPQALGRITHTLLHTRFPVDQAAIQEHLEREGSWEGELLHTCRDGHTVVVESRQAVLRDAHGQLSAIMEINRDITRRRELEQAARLAHSETVAHLSFLQQVLDALPSSVYLVSGEQARLLLANHASASLWGAAWPIDQSMEAFLAERRITLLDEQGHHLSPEQYATLRAVQHRETVLYQQETIHRADGSSLPVLVSALPLSARPATGQLAAQDERVALVVHQDVSALKQAEYLKDEFIALAAHELRNPLAALKGFADMLVYQTARGKGPALASWQQEALAEIEQATSRLNKLTQDLLDVTRLQAGRLIVTRKPTELVDMIRHLVVQAQVSAQQHAITLQTPLSSLTVEVDRGRIEQVLSNLLSNAVKYSPQGGAIEVVLWEEPEPHALLLSVRDYGIGIPLGQQARIFGRFVRAENAREMEIAGTGLGLYLSRELLELHGGQLWFESTEGAGTTFFLKIPLP